MKKSTISALLLLVMLLTITAASAAETNDTSDLSIPDEGGAVVEQTDSPAVDDLLTADNNTEVLAAGEGTFTDLQNDINAGGSTPILYRNYARVEEDNEVSITSDVTILGQNHVIDAKNLGRIFNISPGVSVQLVGVTLINGVAEEGGAIYNEGSLVLSGSNLSNNTADNRGGAIYNTGSLTISSSTLDGNGIKYLNDTSNGGAAVYSNAATVTKISNSFITNNVAFVTPRGGTGGFAGSLISGAVTSFNSLDVVETLFENNKGAYGGAIYCSGDELSILQSSKFIDNYAYYGGAIYFTGAASNIADSEFKGNKARGTGDTIDEYSDGGAIYAPNADVLVVSGSTFEENSAAIGGAISAAKTAIDNCNFKDNDASAEYSGQYNGVNNTLGGFGDAISSTGLTISNSGFINNGLNVVIASIQDSSFNSSVIEANDGDLTISNNTYDNDGYDIIGDNNTSVHLLNLNGDIPKIIDADVYLDVTTFTELQDFINSQSRATIHLNNHVSKVESERAAFENGITIDSPIVIDGQNHEIWDEYGAKVFNITENGSLTLLNTTVKGVGNGFIVNNGQVILDADNPNTFNEVTYVIENDGGIVCQMNMETFTQLDNLIALVHGGTINISSSRITKQDYEKDTYKEGISVANRMIMIVGDGADAIISAADGGRIFKVTDNGFLYLEKLAISGGSHGNGGAIYVSDDSSFTANAVSFTDNAAESDGVNGGAIYSEGSVFINNSTFALNTAEIGGTIYNLGTLTVWSSNFTGQNRASIGGAIFTSSETEIYNCYFAGNDGCAIASDGAVSGKEYTLTVVNSRFENNHAPHGSAILVNDSKLIVDESTFENNEADFGAILVGPGAGATIRNSNFTGNEGMAGSAISFYEGYANSTIDNCVFNENKNRVIGAISIAPTDSSVVTVKNSIFNNNTGKGSAIHNCGILYLSNNTILETDSGIHTEIVCDTGGIITSKLTAVVLGGRTINVDDVNVKLNATLVDDMGNFIYDESFNFTIFDVRMQTDSNLTAEYNFTTNSYEAVLELQALGNYTVGMVSNNPNVEVYVANLVYTKGSFTDLYRVYLIFLYESILT